MRFQENALSLDDVNNKVTQLMVFWMRGLHVLQPHHVQVVPRHISNLGPRTLYAGMRNRGTEVAEAKRIRRGAQQLLAVSLPSLILGLDMPLLTLLYRISPQCSVDGALLPCIGSFIDAA